MLFLVKYEIRDGEQGYDDYRFLDAKDCGDAEIRVKDDLHSYFDEDTEVIEDNWVEHKRGYPAAKVGYIAAVDDLEDVIARIGYIGTNKPRIDTQLFFVSEEDVDEVLQELKESEEIELTPEQRLELIQFVREFDYSEIASDINSKAIEIAEGISEGN